MPLFRIVQASGKERLISDARKGGHNFYVSEEETIWVPSADFIPEATRILLSTVAEGTWSEGPEVVPDWAIPTAFPDDLDDAYGQCPAKPEQQRACIVCWFDPDSKV